MPFTILVVDDEPEMCASLCEIFSARGLVSLSASDPREVPGLLQRERVDLVILDVAMPQRNGIDVLKSLKGHDPTLPVIMITGYPSVESAVESMRYGALNFFIKPLKTRLLVAEIERLRASRESAAGAESREASLVTANPEMQKILREMERVARTDAPVLVTGESGTGKELVAAAIHQASGRTGPYVKVNCAAIPDSLLESEMFGHEQGAFTDAIRRRVGKLELADRGTLFLDEIGDMTAATQPKLLRVLQDGEFQRLGGGETVRSTARIIAATNTDVETLVSEGRLRQDLFYRLSVVTIHLPALRERKDDLELLVDHFLKVFRAKYGRRVDSVAPAVKDVLYRHAWPGNVRELRNCIERAVIFCDGPRIEEEHLPAQYLKLKDPGFPDSLEAVYEKLSRQRIADALARSSGEKQKAARLLNISRKTLYNRMKRLGME